MPTPNIYTTRLVVEPIPDQPADKWPKQLSVTYVDTDTHTLFHQEVVEGYQHTLLDLIQLLP